LPFAFCLLTRLLPFAFEAFAFEAKAEQRAGGVIVDQILVLVNDDPVTRTDLLWRIALDPQAPSPAEQISSDLLDRELEGLLNERLIAQEAARLPGAEVTAEEIAQKRAELIRRFSSEAAFRQRVASVGLTPERIDEILRQRILIERFIEFRFRAFVLVTDADIQKYYDGEFARRMREVGEVRPPLDAMLEKGTVRDQIRELIRQEKIGQEYDRWLTTARQRADIVVLAEP
jgi:hypothetical protein